MFRLFDEQTSSEIWIADLSGSTLTPTSLTVRVAGRLGRTIDECTLDVRAYDFWQNDLVKETLRPTVDGDWEKTWTFPASASGETRAIIRYSLPDGQYVRRFLNARGDVRTGLRRRMPLSDFARKDAQKDAKTVASVLTKTVTVPDWLREGRTLLAAERIYRTGKAFVNGREIGVQTRANQALPCEYDITDALAADGKAEIRFEVEMQKGEAPLTDVEIRCAPATRLVLRPVITTKLEGRTLKVETPSVPAGCAVSHRVLRRGKEVLKPFSDGETVSWPGVELWGPTSFPLYELESSLVKNGKTIDRHLATVSGSVATFVADSAIQNGGNYASMATGTVMMPDVGLAVTIDDSLAPITVATSAGNAKVVKDGNRYYSVASVGGEFDITDVVRLAGKGSTVLTNGQHAVEGKYTVANAFAKGNDNNTRVLLKDEANDVQLTIADDFCPGQEIVVTSYTIRRTWCSSTTTADDNKISRQRAPISFALEGSEDGTTWKVIDMRSGISWETDPSAMEMTFAVVAANLGSYRAYRFRTFKTMRPAASMI